MPWWPLSQFWATQPQSVIVENESLFYHQIDERYDAFDECYDNTVEDDWMLRESDLINNVDGNSDSDDDETVGGQDVEMDAGTKKRMRSDQLAAAREAKARIKIADGELRAQFFEDKVAPDGIDDDANDAMLKYKSFRYRVAMERVDEGFPWILKHVAACAAISEKTVRSYYAVWKKLAVSNPSDRVQIFEYYVMHKKRGRQMADPVAMWNMMKRADELIDKGHGEKCSSIRTVFKNVALPEMLRSRQELGKNILAGASIFKRSFSSMRRLINVITPHLRKGVKKLCQERAKANKNPAGGMSMVAGLPWILKGVHPYNIVCLDSLTTYVNENVPKQAYLTAKKKKQLEGKRRGVKATTGNAQRRSLKINLGVVRGPEPLITCTAIVSDTEFTSLRRFPITPSYDIIFSPHSPDDEKIDHEFESQDQGTLKYRQSKMLYDECVMPKVMSRGQAMMDFAKEVLNLPDAAVQSAGVMRLFQDGEGGIIHHIMNTLAGTLGKIVEGKPSSLFAKGPNAQTESWQVNDVSGIHPTIHEGFKSEEFSCLSKESVRMIINENPGLIPALQHLNDSSMNTKSKETYHNALSYLIPLVRKAVTPAVVDEAFDQAGLHPLNFGKIMHNMYDHFDQLTPEQAVELVRIASEELGPVFESRGTIWSRETEAAIVASPILNQVIDFPEMPPNLEHLAWNRQTLVDCSHSCIQQINAERIVAAEAARLDVVQRKSSKAEIEARFISRYETCAASQDPATKKFNCHCGGMFDGRAGFKGHEKSEKHVARYGTVNEHGEYVQ
jgi:hypothetical protein